MLGQGGPKAPFIGTRSDAPVPRDRTPSPVRSVGDMANKPLPARSFEIVPSEIDVVYAEDEEVFRETAIRELLKVGFLKSKIHEAENGLGALEHLSRLQMEGNAAAPLLVLLDVRMPTMDGRECALQIQELVKKKRLRREPFVVCISSIHRQVEVDEGKGNFEVVIPKPFGTDYLMETLELLRKWWTMGVGRELPAWKEFDLTKIDTIAADDEPICRMSSATAFTQAGLDTNHVNDVEDEEELMEAVEEAQEGDQGRPLVILLGKETWAQPIKDFVDARRESNTLKREPFVICTSVDSNKIGTTKSVELFHAFLPGTTSQADVKWCLEYLRRWWLTRGDGERAKERHAGDSSSDESEVASVMSEMSAD